MQSVRAAAVGLVVVTSLSGAVIGQCPLVTAAQPVVGPGGHDLEALSGARLLVGGSFTLPGGGNNVAVLDRAAQVWDLLGGGCNGVVHSVVELSDGDLVAGGSFFGAGGVPVNCIARWDGLSWHAMGGGPLLPLGNADIRAMHVRPDGDLIVGGNFTSIDGVPAAGIARWDGASWSAIGNAPTMRPTAIVTLANGDLVVGTDLHPIWRWDGATWTTIGTTNAFVETMLAHSDGSLYVGGAFDQVDGVDADFVARWDGATWSPLGTGVFHFCRGLAELPDGDVLVAFTGDFALEPSGPVLVRGLGRWDGQHWSSFGTGRDGFVLDIARNDDDSYSFGGQLSEVCGVPTNGLATVASGCPAAAVPFGVGCPSWAGPVTLEALSCPWLGGDYQALVAGLPPLPTSVALALSVYGFAVAPVPLSPALPAGPGCFLLPTADVLDLRHAMHGVAVPGFAVPVQPALVGTVLYHQVLGLELGAGLIDVSASNGLQLTIGVL
ncbi:MAG: hypothetical protein R3F29_06725 [Planctomycetota bacterium]